MARLAKKEYVHNAGNKQVYYCSFSRTLIARTFSNFDVHFKTKLDFLALAKDHQSCSTLAKYVFQNTAYTWLISAIAKHYDSPVYKQQIYLAGPAKLLTSTVLDTITDEETKTLFEDFVVNGNYHSKEFKVNGQKVLLTTSQIAAVALVYSLNNKEKISKEIKYTGPEERYIIVDTDGNQTAVGAEKEKRATELRFLKAKRQKDKLKTPFRKTKVFKTRVHDTGNGLVQYKNRAQSIILKTFSNFDFHFKTKDDYITAIQKCNSLSCTAVSKYFFGSDCTFTGVLYAILKYHELSLYDNWQINAIFEVITDKEMKNIFNDFVMNAGYQDKSFSVNGKIKNLTRYQIITIAMLYALKNKDVISKELGYDSPMKKFILRDTDGNKTKTCIEKEKRAEMFRAIRPDTWRKRKVGKMTKVKKAKAIKSVKFTDTTLYSCKNSGKDLYKDSGSHSCTCNDCGTSCNEEPACNVSCNCDGNCKPATKPMKVTSTPKHVMKIDAIRNNIEKFACCVSAADEPDFKKTSDIIIAIMAASAASGDDTKNHDVADAVIKTSLKDKQHLVNIFEMIING